MNHRKWLKVRLFMLTGLTVGAVLVGSYWLLVRDRRVPPSTDTGEHVPPTLDVSCRVRFLEPAERLQAINDFLATGERKAFPADQSANPVLHSDRYAVVRVENLTREALYLFSLDQDLVEAHEMNREQAALMRSVVARAAGTPNGEHTRRYYEPLIKQLEAPFLRTLTSAFAVEEESRAADGAIVVFSSRDLLMLSQCRTPRVPSAEDLLGSSHTVTFTMQPGEGIDLPIYVLGRRRHDTSRLVPGAYTVRAAVSYALAPSGEARRITSEPVTVTVTEEHIRAAEAYWGPPRK